MQISDLSLYGQIYILFFVGILGLIIGSFTNCVALRLLAEESFILPRSKCPKCKKMIAWFDNIPVLSYLILGGKCRNCKEHISIQYPIVEICTSILFIMTVLFFGLTLKSLFLLLLIANMVVMTITDLKEKVIYDCISISLIPIGLIYSFFNIGQSTLGTVDIFGIAINETFIMALIGVFAGFAFFEISSRIGLLLLGEYAFGMGDSIIAAGFGAWFGWKAVIIIIILSFLFQLVIGIPILFINMYKDKDYKSIIALIIMTLSIGIPYVANSFGFSQTLTGALISAIVSLGMALYGIIIILSTAKERKSFTILPFGPALILGALTVVFYGDYFISKLPILN